MLDRSILVLNKGWTPIAVTTVKRGFSLVFKDHASIIHPESYELYNMERWFTEYSVPAEKEEPSFDFVRTTSVFVRLPEVVVLGRYNGVPRHELAFNRRNVFRRDDFTCQYCGSKPGAKHLSIDHIFPSSRGGGNSWQNCVVACVKCNTRKGNQTPREANMPLISEPGKPNWNDGVGAGEQAPKSWSAFIKV
ncbi:MAG: HNH endonuclease [Planctomycetota bacterium]|jgi:5-methylcytosine-specific restriction endonuclease McrA